MQCLCHVQKQMCNICCSLQVTLTPWMVDFNLLSTIFSDLVKNLNEIHISSSRDCWGWAVIKVFGRVVMSCGGGDWSRRQVYATFQRNNTHRHSNIRRTQSTRIYCEIAQKCVFSLSKHELKLKRETPFLPTPNSTCKIYITFITTF